MPSQEDIEAQRELLATHRRTLSVYLRQLASTGITHAPPALMNGIQDARGNIARIKRVLHSWGVEVADHPDDEAPLDLGEQSHTKPRSSVHQKFSTHQRRRWLISGMLGGGVVLVILLSARLLTNPGTATSSQSFAYTFLNGTSDWSVDDQADANKWQVVEVTPSNFVYQGTVPSDQDHDITSAPPSNDIIKDWQGYAVETKVRVVHSTTDDSAFSIMMRGTDNALSGCWGYRYLFNTKLAEAEIDLDGPEDRCPPKVLIHGAIPIGGDQWFIVRTEAVGVHLRLYIDGKLILQVDNPVLSKGYFAVTVAHGATVQFDDIRIWEITEDTKSIQSSKLAL